VRITILRYNANYYKFLLLSRIIYHISELIHKIILFVRKIEFTQLIYRCRFIYKYKSSHRNIYDIFVAVVYARFSFFLFFLISVSYAIKTCVFRHTISRTVRLFRWYYAFGNYGLYNRQTSRRVQSAVITRIHGVRATACTSCTSDRKNLRPL